MKVTLIRNSLQNSSYSEIFGILFKDRIFPHQTAPYEYWNGPPQGVRSPIIMESIADETGFTAVILGTWGIINFADVILLC